MSSTSANSIKLISGRSHPELFHHIADKLGISLANVLVTQLPNQESAVALGESVRDEDVFVMQTTHPGNINNAFIEMLIMISACKQASARRITAVIPAFPYSRQDKKDKSRAPISAKLVANMIQTAGTDHVITMDLHASQIQGFFDVAVDNLYAEPTVVRYLRTNYAHLLQDAIIVSPDAGGVKRATALSDKLGLNIAVIHKERPQASQISRMTLIGDVAGKVAIIVDDMADTCGTLAKAADVLIEHGTKSVMAVVTHGILSGDAVEKINRSKLEKLIVTNTVPLEGKEERCQKLEVIDISHVLGEAIRRSHNGESVSSLFHDEQMP